MRGSFFAAGIRGIRSSECHFDNAKCFRVTESQTHELVGYGGPKFFLCIGLCFTRLVDFLRKKLLRPGRDFLALRSPRRRSSAEKPLKNFHSHAHGTCCDLISLP